jgi:hypothetical protein
MLPVSPAVINVYRTAAVRRGDEQEIWSLIAFSRGLLVGFVSAFLLFDWMLLDAETTLGVLRGLRHVTYTAL